MTVNEALQTTRDRHGATREKLITDIAGPDAYPQQCKCASPAECTCKLNHVSLKQLVKLKFQRFDPPPGRVSFATTLALRVDRSRGSLATTAGPAGSPPKAATVKEDSYGDDAEETNGYSSAGGGKEEGEGDGEPGEGEGGESGRLDHKTHITQTELRIRQLRACVALPPRCNCALCFSCVCVCHLRLAVCACVCAYACLCDCMYV